MRFRHYISSLIACVFTLSALALSSCSHSYDIAAIDNAINSQMHTYSESTLKDIYKNFFQDAFGPGHLISGGNDAEQSMRRYLEAECKEAENEFSSCPTYELTGWHGRFYRVSLSVINDSIVPFDTFMDAFMESASQFKLPEVKEWEKEWDVICNETRRLYHDIPEFSRDSVQIKQMLAQGQYASHHSEEYNRAYHPHYRLIERSVFENRLLKLIEKQ